MGRDLLDNRSIILRIPDFSKILALIAVFYVFFFPTSINGNIIGSMYIVRNGAAIVLTAFLFEKNIINVKALGKTFFILIWLSVLTVSTYFLYFPNDFRVAFASISGFLPTVFIWCLIFKHNTLDCKFMLRTVNILSFIICVWGWGLVFKNTLVIKFTQNFYSMLTDNMFNNMVLRRGKPVMSFGTHSMAAYFVMILFFYNCVIIKEKKGTPLNYIYLVLLFLLEIPMDSNTGIVAMCVMAGLFVWAKNNFFTRTALAAALVVIVVYMFYSGFITEIVFNRIINEFSRSHGFIARYFSGIYEGNIYMATHYVGVGFLRSASEYFRMNDSGIIYLFTQGNIPAVILVYGLMYGFMKKNMNKYCKLTFLLFFMWEFVAASTFISVRMVFAHILTLFVVNSVAENNNKEKDVVV